MVNHAAQRFQSRFLTLFKEILFLSKKSLCWCLSHFTAWYHPIELAAIFSIFVLNIFQCVCHQPHTVINYLYCECNWTTHTQMLFPVKQIILKLNLSHIMVSKTNKTLHLHFWDDTVWNLQWNDLNELSNALPS